MAKRFTVEHEGHTISVVNSAATCKLEIDGEVNDVYFGMFVLAPIVLVGTIYEGDLPIAVRASVGCRLVGVDCAILVNDRLEFSTVELTGW
jgi:hypothetical protein